jgi:hypothetical protein
MERMTKIVIEHKQINNYWFFLGEESGNNLKPKRIIAVKKCAELKQLTGWWMNWYGITTEHCHPEIINSTLITSSLTKLNWERSFGIYR